MPLFPFPTHLRFRLAAIEFDSARIELDVQQSHFQLFGIVHGGVLATTIDTATFWAVFMHLPQDFGLVNIDLKLSYLAPLSDGRLVGEGRCIRSGRSRSYTEAGVKDEEGPLLAQGTLTLRPQQGKGTNLKARKFLDGDE